MNSLRSELKCPGKIERAQSVFVLKYNTRDCSATGSKIFRGMMVSVEPFGCTNEKDFPTTSWGTIVIKRLINSFETISMSLFNIDRRLPELIKCGQNNLKHWQVNECSFVRITLCYWSIILPKVSSALARKALLHCPVSGFSASPSRRHSFIGFQEKQFVPYVNKTVCEKARASSAFE